MTTTRLNYIGSKYQLLDWLTNTIRAKTGLSDFTGATVADLFAGTGIVAHHFRQLGATVVANDAELYSATIAHALVRGTYGPRCQSLLATVAEAGDAVGPITTHYSPYGSNERKFFTVENAQRIDAIRAAIASLRPTISDDEHAFLLASLLVSADAVSNVPAVYGCYLKKFKAKALKPLTLVPIHTLTAASLEGSRVTQGPAAVATASTVAAESAPLIYYIDPPYNERQYSKNYFPLNIIAADPSTPLPPLRGITGIPADCFLSDFCRRSKSHGGGAHTAFAELFASIATAAKDSVGPTWVFVSYNSEGIVSRDEMIAMMAIHGTVSVTEREYKRFKSFAYNADTPTVTEYLFCLQVHDV